jgi:hypothetical protein
MQSSLCCHRERQLKRIEEQLPENLFRHCGGLYGLYLVVFYAENFSFLLIRGVRVRARVRGLGPAPDPGA